MLPECNSDSLRESLSCACPLKLLGSVGRDAGRGHRVWELYFKGSKSGGVRLGGEGDTGSVFEKIA